MIFHFLILLLSPETTWLYAFDAGLLFWKFEPTYDLSILWFDQEQVPGLETLFALKKAGEKANKMVFMK